MRPGRVFMTADAVGGVWTYALDAAAGLADCGVRTSLAVLGPSPSPAQVRQAAAIPGLALQDTGLPLDWMVTDEPTFRAAAAALAELAHESGADLVHLNSPAYGQGGFRVPVVGACHSCLASWWAAVRGGEMPPEFAVRTRRLAEGYRACARLVAPSAAFAQVTRTLYGVDVEVIWNGRAPDGRRPDTAKSPLVLTSGRLWDEGKNLAALDAAAARMAGRVTAIGPLHGPDGAVVAAQAVQTPGAYDAPEMTQALNAASVFVSLALYEPFGLGVLEAAQAGCALVLSDIPTFRELWEGAAVFVDPAQPGAVAQTLDDLLADPEAARALGGRSADRAGRYDGASMSRSLVELYGRALTLQARETAA